MATSAQAKVLKIVQEKIEREGLECVKRERFANAGTLAAQVPGAFGDLVTVDYGFQDSNFSLTISELGAGGKMVPKPSQPGRADYFKHLIGYAEKGRFDVFLLDLAQALVKHRSPAVKQAMELAAKNGKQENKP